VQKWTRAQLPLRLSLFVTRTTSQKFGTVFSNFIAFCILYGMERNGNDTGPFRDLSRKVFRIGTVRYNWPGLRMRHRPSA